MAVKIVESQGLVDFGQCHECIVSGEPMVSRLERQRNGRELILRKEAALGTLVRDEGCFNANDVFGMKHATQLPGRGTAGKGLGPPIC